VILRLGRSTIWQESLGERRRERPNAIASTPIRRGMTEETTGVLHDGYHRRGSAGTRIEIGAIREANSDRVWIRTSE